MAPEVLTLSSQQSALINTPLQRGVQACWGPLNRFNPDFSLAIFQRFHLVQQNWPSRTSFSILSV